MCNGTQMKTPAQHYQQYGYKDEHNSCYKSGSE